MPDVVSAVGGGALGVSINIRNLANSPVFEQTAYNPEIISFIKIQIGQNSPSIMLYGSGKYNIAGAASVNELKRSHHRLVEILQDEFGYEIESSTFELRYLTTVGKYPCELELEALHESADINTEYDPSQNPGLVYRPEESESTVFIIYRTGKVVLTGVGSEEEAESLFTEFFELIDGLFGQDRTSAK